MNKVPKSLTGLLSSRRFGPLFITQFLGALNDNVLKNAMVVLLTFQAAQWSSIPPELLANIAAGIFILPFFLFSATAGQLADKFDKARIARGVKLFEMVVVLVAALGFAMHNIWVLFLALFLLGLHSSIFGPVKYAILPQHLKTQELLSGNALIEAGTFIAILLGTALGAWCASLPHAGLFISIMGFVFAMLGYFACRYIPSATPPMPNLSISINLVSETCRNMRNAKAKPLILLCIVAISWFWLYGALLLTQFPALAKNTLHGDESVVTLLLLVFTVGIGLGSVWCHRLCRGRINIQIVFIGALGLSALGLALAYLVVNASTTGTLNAMALLSTAQGVCIVGVLFALGLCGGLYSVPLYTLLLKSSPALCRARMVASNNIFNALFMVVGALYATALLAHGVSIPQLFSITAGINALLVLYGLRLWLQRRRRLAH